MVILIAWHVVLWQLIEAEKFIDLHIASEFNHGHIRRDTSVASLVSLYRTLLIEHALLPFLLCLSMLPALAVLPQRKNAAIKWTLLSLLWAALAVFLHGLLWINVLVHSIEWHCAWC